MRGLFVTGTGTGVGKTILSAALLAAMRATGEPVRAHKPVVTGLAEPPGTWPPDHELLALAAGMAAEEVAPLRFQPPVSPHLAGLLADQPIDAAGVLKRAKTCASASETLIVEGIGGLLVPLAHDLTVRDLAVELALPLLIAAPPGLGTINHTLLTLEAARVVGLRVAAVVLTPWPTEPSPVELSNQETIARMGAVDIATLEEISSADTPALAGAGGRLPWRDWLSRTSFVPTRP
ncbi:MAG TPA: dethiobiotin synthase [Solirubrobacteraceae bacterium]|nr:dethiobiotin synthase [Solirubrobacteraceae bacterium]